MVTTRVMTRRFAVAALAVTVLGGIAACSSGSPAPAPSHSAGPSPSPSASQTQQGATRYTSAPALLTACAISHGVQGVLTSARHYNSGQSGGQQWLRGTKVELTAGNGSAFTDWFQNGGGAAVAIAGRRLSDWAQSAASSGSLPAQVCGTEVRGSGARSLYAQVYAGWPSMLSSDPWGQ